MSIYICGPKELYHGAVKKKNNVAPQDLKDLGEMLAKFDVRFGGGKFHYRPGDHAVDYAILYEDLDIDAAVGLVGAGIGIEINGYFWCAKFEEPALSLTIPSGVDAWFPNAKSVDDDGVVTVKTFQEALETMTEYNPITDGTSIVIGNLGSRNSITDGVETWIYPLIRAYELSSIDGVTILDRAAFDAFVATIPVE